MRRFGRIFLIVLVLVAIIIGFGYWGYSSIEGKFGKTNSIEPKLKTDFVSVLYASGHILSGDYPEAVSEIVEGLVIKGTIDIHNSSYMPLYIPDLKHQVFINDTQIGEPFTINGGWIGPRGEKSLSIEVVLPLDDLPELALTYIFTGGNLPLELKTTLQIGPLSFSKTSSVTMNITNPISDLIA